MRCNGEPHTLISNLFEIMSEKLRFHASLRSNLYSLNKRIHKALCGSNHVFLFQGMPRYLRHSNSIRLVRNLFKYVSLFNRLTPNDLHMSRTAPLTSKHSFLYIYSTNVGTEYFKHALYSPFLSLQNAVCFITPTCLVPVLFIFYI